MKTVKQTFAVLPAAVVLLVAASSHAGSITFAGSGLNPTTSSGLAAEVTFENSGSNLIVTLKNSFAGDVTAPSDVLTGVFFDLGGDYILGRVSAVLDVGSTVLFGGTDPGGVVGGEWAYKHSSGSGLASAVAEHYGIGSAGYGIFGPAERFPGTNLQGPASPNGVQYGITSAGDDPATGNTPVTGTNALIKNAVVFTLSGLPLDFDVTDISSVRFQYGTALDEPWFYGTPPNDPPPAPPSPTPEPTSMLLWALGIGGLFVASRFRKT